MAYKFKFEVGSCPSCGGAGSFRSRVSRSSESDITGCKRIGHIKCKKCGLQTPVVKGSSREEVLLRSLLVWNKQDHDLAEIDRSLVTEWRRERRREEFDRFLEKMGICG